MEVQSSVFSHQENIPQKYTCDGDDINPSFSFIDAPVETKSFAFIMHDPDAPAGDWVHWLIWNILGDDTGIKENTVPSGAMQGKNDFGLNTYGGPCPSSGEHHYVFELYALDQMLDIPAGSDIQRLKTAMKPHILEEAQLIGLYKRTS